MKSEFDRHSALYIPILGLFILTLCIFRDMILGADNVVLSSPCYYCDMIRHFLPSRFFAFNELKAGNLALWNPHIYSGMPFFANFQSAILYPLNLIFLFFPLVKAVNLSIALHVFGGGVFMYLWAYYRELHPIACFIAAVEFMFCGPHFLHIYAGHLSNLCTLVWIPLILLSIDGLFNDKSIKWALLGMAAVSMQIFAGHPQYVFYSFVTAAIYTGIRLVTVKERLRIFSLFFLIYFGAILMSAIQLFPGYQIANESIRSSGVSYEFASWFSLPFESILTWLIPTFWGNNMHFPYWGQWLFWETSLFFGVTGFGLAIYGIFFVREKQKNILLLMVIILMIFALGANTPLFDILYHYLPGFNKFRGLSKFALYATLFLILISATAFDHILKNGFKKLRLLSSLSFLGFFLSLIIAFFIRKSGLMGEGGFWYHLLGTLSDYYRAPPLQAPGFFDDYLLMQQAAFFSSKSIMILSGLFLILCFILIFSKFNSKAPLLLVVLLIAELFIFARVHIGAFNYERALPHQLNKFAHSLDQNIRITNRHSPNISMILDTQDIWGDDPFVSKRYAEFMAFTQGVNPESATQHLLIRQPHRFFEMLRCRYAVNLNREKLEIKQLTENQLPMIKLVPDWRIAGDKEETFKLMMQDSFDPNQTVILESDPNLPEKAIKLQGQNRVRVIDTSTDHLTIKAEIKAPAILLITNSYSKGWVAYPLEKRGQKKYEVLPANHALTAVPLKPGKHSFRVEYLPFAFIVGKWISLISIGFFFGAILLMVRQRRLSHLHE